MGRKIIASYSAKEKHGQNAQSINPTTHKTKMQTQHSTNEGHGRSIVQKKSIKTKQEDKKSSGPSLSLDRFILFEIG